jgi:putative ABC transport system ATP-binding protein
MSGSPESDVVLDLRGVAKHYVMGVETVRALDGVDLVVRLGEYVAIMGPSGSGKSTMLNILGCMDLPTEGSYFLGGENVAELSQSALSRIRGRRIGFVFQTFELLARSTALQNVMLPLLYSGVKDKKKRALDALDRVGLSNRTHHRPNELSGGQRQRVAIARALAQQPDIVLADEPTGNLDSKTGQEILALFDKLNSEGQTIVIVTHDPGVAARCRRVVRLSDGRVVGDGPPSVVLEQLALVH